MPSDHGWLALFVLLVVPFFTVVAFRDRRPGLAAAVVTFGCALFLPEVAYFKLPLFPPLDKGNIPYLVMLALVVVRYRNFAREQKPLSGEDLLAFAAAFAAVLTATSNEDPISFGTWRRTFLPGMNLKDGLALTVDDIISVWAPFYIGRVFLRDAQDLRDLFRVLVLAGLVYAPFALWEVRMSPQLHVQIYGHPAHPDFAQSIRWGGYRPMLFMAHGLAVALFFFTATCAATVLARNHTNVVRLAPKYVALFLGFVFVLTKSTGAIAYALLAIPVLLYASPKTMARFAAILLFVVLLYPVLRANQLFPVDTILEIAHGLSPERAQSLAFRFANEDVLLERASLRPFFGWGSYGRNLIYDMETGSLRSVTDGQWIIWLGSRGIVGLLCFLGFLAIPVFRAGRVIDRIHDPELAILLASLALIVSFHVVDLVPNALFTSYPLFLAGALSGLTRRVRTR